MEREGDIRVKRRAVSTACVHMAGERDTELMWEKWRRTERAREREREREREEKNVRGSVWSESGEFAVLSCRSCWGNVSACYMGEEEIMSRVMWCRCLRAGDCRVIRRSLGSVR